MKLHELSGIQTFANITNAFLTSNTLSACVHPCFFINLNQSVRLKLDHFSHPTEDTIFFRMHANQSTCLFGKKKKKLLLWGVQFELETQPNIILWRHLVAVNYHKTAPCGVGVTQLSAFSCWHDTTTLSKQDSVYYGEYRTINRQ